MWSRLIDKAHADGKHVFWIYGRDGDAEPVTQENKDRVMKDYYGKGEEYGHKHLVLSHTDDLPFDIK